MAPNTILSSALLLVGGAAAANFYSNGLAVTPQMGWDNWNAFGCDVSADLLEGTAQRMVEIGLRDAGYYYVILDDCWSDGRYSNGSLKPDFTKFPDGMGAVGDKMHDLGLGFGMYSSAGEYTCAQYAGSLGHETSDANSFASWGVDYLKYDNCYNNGQSGNPLISYTRYHNMSLALNATGRPILYSMCNWGEDGPWNWAATMANSWRATGDITDSFDEPDVRCPCTGDEGYDCLLPGFHCSVMNILNKVSGYPSKAQPGAWNDLDALEVGNGGQTDDEYKLHMTMWAAVKSPLIMGTDIRILPATAYTIYTNPAILAISQDPLGNSAVRRWRYFVNETDQYGQGEISMYSGNLAQGDQVLVLLNAGNSSRMMNATLAEIFVDSGGAKAKEAQLTYDMYDLWANRMPNETAAMILENNSTQGIANLTNYYWNVTEKSYADGIMANETVLMGTHCGSVAPLGTITAEVPRHGVAAYRLRPRATASSMKRDEL